MLSQLSTELMHQIVGYLLQPVIWGLLAFVALAVWESGTAIGERLWGLRSLRHQASLSQVMRIGRRRIERSDLLTRVAPMLGLMGTLVPLGPGLAGLGRGDIAILTGAIQVAFDTTVLGLLVGIIGFILGKLRRRWYDQLIDALESAA